MTLRKYYDHYWTASTRPYNELGRFIEDVLSATLTCADSCIDVGCGDGATIVKWGREGLNLTGVDVSATAVELAQNAGLNALLVSDAADLPFESDTFDVGICLEVLEHLLAPADAAREILRVLRPGGVFLLTVPNVAYWRRRADLAALGRWNPMGDSNSVAEPWRDPHIRFFTTGALERMLRGAGFTDVLVGGHGGAFFRDLPLPRTSHRPPASLVYRQAERLFPGLFGARLHAVGTKAGMRLGPTHAAIGAVRSRSHLYA